MKNRPHTSFLASLMSRFGAQKAATKKTESRTASPPARPFQAISIYHGTVCCSTAKEISGYRFLAKSAPQLPLSDCTMRAKCECRYMKHIDRRADSRRLDDYGLKQQLFAAKERRARRGRRLKD